jgi:hypothetical protein
MSFDACVPLGTESTKIKHRTAWENDRMLSLMATPNVGPKGRNRVVKKISEFILSRLGVGLLAVARLQSCFPNGCPPNTPFRCCSC